MLLMYLPTGMAAILWLSTLLELCQEEAVAAVVSVAFHLLC